LLPEIEPPEPDSPEDLLHSSLSEKDEEESEPEVVASLRAEIVQLKAELEKQKAKIREAELRAAS
jgi:uncharacterized small protein (DUF1192 family)